MKKLLAIFFVLGLSLNNSFVLADGNKHTDDACPVGLVTGMTIDEEFGAGINDITRCIENRKRIKMVMQVNNACRDTAVTLDPATATGLKLDNHANTCGATRGFGIAQMKNMIKDWVITHGMPAESLDLNIIVHDGGGSMLMKNPANQLKPAVEELLNGTIPGAEGVKVKFHFCMNTVRGMAKKVNKTPAQIVMGVIPGVTYVTGGLTALADFQKEGYYYIQP